MGDEVLLKPIQKGCWSVFHLGLLHHHHTLEVGMNSGWLQIGPNGNVGVVERAVVRVINTSELLAEQVVETLMDVVSLAHDNGVPLDSRVADGSYGVDLLHLPISGKVTANKHPCVLSPEQTHGEERAYQRVILGRIDDELVADLILRQVLHSLRSVLHAVL